MSDPRIERRIAGSWPGSSGWLRINAQGDLELELFDYSQEAQSSLGGDVAWVWTLSSAHFPALLSRLPVSAIRSESALLDCLLQQHTTVHSLKNWLLAIPVPLTESFDSQA